MGTFGGQRRVSHTELHDRETGLDLERYSIVLLVFAKSLRFDWFSKNYNYYYYYYFFTRSIRRRMAKRRRGKTGFAVSLRRHWFDDEKRIQIPRESRVENRTVRTHAFGQNRFGEGPVGYVTHDYFLSFFFSAIRPYAFFNTYIVSNVMISDEPSKPNNVEVVDWDVDHADLKWTKPDSDNGAPITGYVIEYKVTSINFILNPLSLPPPPP